MEKEYDLVEVETPQDWETYHKIRREELFEAKGHVGVYDPNRPEEHEPNKISLLLKYKGLGIGTARLDILTPTTAILRLVAVTHSEQKKGHGWALGQLVEQLAQAKGVKKIFINAVPDAIGYYEKLGFVREDWNPAELTGISANAIQMSKSLL